jgi:hypothetical protein
MAVVVVSGADRGIGLEFAKQYLAKGDKVYALCRSMSITVTFCIQTVKFCFGSQMPPISIYSIILAYRSGGGRLRSRKSGWPGSISRQRSQVCKPDWRRDGTVRWATWHVTAWRARARPSWCRAL